jgi:hypothetical protein
LHRVAIQALYVVMDSTPDTTVLIDWETGSLINYLYDYNTECRAYNPRYIQLIVYFFQQIITKRYSF